MARKYSDWYVQRRTNEAYQAVTGTGRYSRGNKRDMEYAVEEHECSRRCDCDR